MQIFKQFALKISEIIFDLLAVGDQNDIEAVRDHRLNLKWYVLFQVIISCHYLLKVVFNSHSDCLKFTLLFFIILLKVFNVHLLLHDFDDIF